MEADRSIVLVISKTVFGPFRGLQGGQPLDELKTSRGLSH